MFGRITFSFVLTFACVGALAVGFLATTVEYLSPPQYRVSLGEVPLASADAWSVFDAESGEVLLAHNAEQTLPIASVTKLAAASAVYRSDALFATTTVSWGDLAAEGRAGSLAAGEVFARHTLLFPLLLESSNDAAAALARADDTLVTRMNARVAEQGLSVTEFVDVAGLSSENVSTARELAALASSVYVEDRHVINVTHLRTYASGGHGWRNSSPFANDPDYRGGKHGYTPAAGHTAVAFFNEELAGGHARAIGYVLLASDDLHKDMALLREHARAQVTYK